MRLSPATIVTLAAIAPFNTFPAQASAQETRPIRGAHEATAPNSQARQDFIELGGKVLGLQKAAPHNHHVSDVEVHAVAPGVQEVELDYTTKRPGAHASLGSYTITALFTGKGKKLTAQNTLEVEVGENAGKRGPSALLGMKKTQDGYSFTGKYRNKAEHYSKTVEATTYPAPDEKELDSGLAANEMNRIMDAAAKGSPITKRRRALRFKTVLPDVGRLSCESTDPPAAELHFNSAAPVAPGDTIGYTITDIGKTCLAFGLPYRWERSNENGEWTDWPTNQAFADPLITLSPGATFNEYAQVPADATPGHYRLLQDFDAYPKQGLRYDPATGNLSYDFTASAELDVAQPK